MIKNAIDEYLSFFSDAGLPYQTNQTRNQTVITSAGTCKQTFGVPQTMTAGVTALQEKTSCLIVGFRELKGFSSHQIKESMEKAWPGLRAATIPFPVSFHELLPEQLAKELEDESCRKKLAEVVRPYVKDSLVVGFPAVLGIQNSVAICKDLEKKLGVAVFEIPTLPPSIPGLRIKNIFEHQLVNKGVETYFQNQVSSVKPLDSETFLVHIGDGLDQLRIHAKSIILATGRFFSKGLIADRKAIREPLFDLPVYQPESRKDWHHENFFSRTGHSINKAGLKVDNSFRPLNEKGDPVFKSLYAAGSILAHQDWMRMKCGSGLSIATAYAAVKAFLKQVKKHDI